MGGRWSCFAPGAGARGHPRPRRPLPPRDPPAGRGRVRARPRPPGPARVPQSPTGPHLLQGHYLRDPDGILLELTLETPERYRSIEIGPSAVSLIDSDGRRRRGTEPLDLEAALAPLRAGIALIQLASGSYVGHVHLHVPDLGARHASTVTRSALRSTRSCGRSGWRTCGAGGRFPHRLAINDWHGSSARQPAAGTARMRSFELDAPRRRAT